jgi:riboflavin synthase
MERGTGVFTGIVEEQGEVADLRLGEGVAVLAVRAPRCSVGSVEGDSIAVDGCCLIITGRHQVTFTADVMAETLARTTLGSLRPGSRVNLERALKADGRVGGHIVQGHVDGTGEVLSVVPTAGYETVRIAVPPDVADFVVPKDSLAVHGVSLTIAGLGEDQAGRTWVEIGLIPKTLARTTLGELAPGRHLNIEADVLAKYTLTALSQRIEAAGRRR